MPIFDLSLTKTVAEIPFGENIPGCSECSLRWTVTVTNNSTAVAASNVTVFDAIVEGYFEIEAPIASAGTSFVLAPDGRSGTWTIGNLAPGQSATLVLHARTNEERIYTNCAEIVTALPLTDIDSTPGNGVGEDDQQCNEVEIITPSGFPRGVQPRRTPTQTARPASVVATPTRTPRPAR